MDNSTSDVGKADLMNLKIFSPEGIIFDGEAKALELLNEMGPFSIFPYHETFITIIKSKVAVYDRSNSRKEYPIENGIIKVYLNKVVIFLCLNLNVLLPENPARQEEQAVKLR